MTCREFKQDTASLTLWELSRTEKEQLLGHAEKCESCGTWLERQRTLAASLQMLQARTASLEAGPDVERALLRAFRQNTPQGADHAFKRVEERSESLRPAVTLPSTPMALRLSRFFEVGAYVAIAAAMLVGVFLGVRLLQPSSVAGPAQSQTAPESTGPVVQKPAVAAAQKIESQPDVSAQSQPAAVAHRTVKTPQPATVSQDKVATAKTVNEDFQNLAEASYTALMFCDPLSCAAETQIVRVELPATASSASQSSQPQMADLVVGYDGVVRAVRIVN